MPTDTQEAAGSGQGVTASSESHDYDARKIRGGLIVSQNGKDIATIRTASPVVEEWRFVNGGKNLVTKSRGNHGPATAELRETSTGTLRDKIPAFAIKNGQPAWAAPHAE